MCHIFLLLNVREPLWLQPHSSDGYWFSRNYGRFNNFGAPHAVKAFRKLSPVYSNDAKQCFSRSDGFTHLGTACLCTSGSECKNIRDLPKALVWAAITFIVVYTLSLVVMIGSIDWRTMSLAESLYVTFAQRIFGTGGAAIVTVAACLATATCTLMGTFYGSSRIFYEEARNGKLPKYLENFIQISHTTKGYL